MDNIFKINIVGNVYQKSRPTFRDKNIIFINEPENIHDKNAVSIISIRKNKIKKLGYVSKIETGIIHKYKNKINILGIKKYRNHQKPHYYTLLANFKK